MNKYVERLYNGIIKENPTFVLMLGMCPTLAVTSSAVNGLGMGLSTTVVLICSNLLISLFRKVIPNGVRMPAYIVIVASLVTVVQFLMQDYLPSLSAALGVYIPLIVLTVLSSDVPRAMLQRIRFFRLSLMVSVWDLDLLLV